MVGLVLANRNGIVLATDSAKSIDVNNKVFTCYDSQKIFKINDECYLMLQNEDLFYKMNMNLFAEFVTENLNFEECETMSDLIVSLNKLFMAFSDKCEIKKNFLNASANRIGHLFEVLENYLEQDPTNFYKEFDSIVDEIRERYGYKEYKIEPSFNFDSLVNEFNRVHEKFFEDIELTTEQKEKLFKLCIDKIFTQEEINNREMILVVKCKNSEPQVVKLHMQFIDGEYPFLQIATNFKISDTKEGYNFGFTFIGNSDFINRFLGQCDMQDIYDSEYIYQNMLREFIENLPEDKFSPDLKAEMIERVKNSKYMTSMGKSLENYADKYELNTLQDLTLDSLAEYAVDLVKLAILQNSFINSDETKLGGPIQVVKI